MISAKEARETLTNIKTAMETAYDFFVNKSDYSYIKSTYTPEQEKAISEFIYSLFDFENGEIIGVNENAINVYLKIKQFKGIK